MSDIFARASGDRATNISAGPSGPASKQLNFPRQNNERIKGPNWGNEELLKQLQAENARLRNKAADLALQIQALRDDGAPFWTFEES